MPRDLPLEPGGKIAYLLPAMFDICSLPGSGSVFTLAGAELIAAASGALYWPAAHTLIVSDLHLEKGSSFASRGVPLPPYDTLATIERLTAALHRDLRRIICLGDSFHDATAADRLPGASADRLRELTAAHEWLWIAGNHDPMPPVELGGTVVLDGLRLGPLTFRHISTGTGEAGEISGHYHPKASVHIRGRRLSGPCFIHDAQRLVMPAFGAYAGGLDVGDPAVRRLFPGAFTVQLLSRQRIARLASSQLSGGVY